MKIWTGLILLSVFFQTAYAVDQNDGNPIKTDRVKTVDELLDRSKQLILKYPDSARKIAEQALVLSEKIQYKYGVGLSFNTIGVSYWVQSFLPVSQFYLTMSVPYLAGDSTALVNAYKDIARNYVDLKDYKNGLHYFMLGLKVAGNKPENKAELYTELTSLYNANGDYVNGLRIIDTAFKYCRATHRTDLQGILYNRLGQIYIQKQQLNLAAPALDTAIKLSYSVKNRRLRAVAIIDQARMAVLKDDYSSAKVYADKSFKLADSIGSPELKIRVLKVLIFIAEKQGDVRQANLLQDKIIELHESTEVLTNQKTLELIQNYFELNTRLHYIEQINNSNSANEKLNRTIAILVVSLIILLAFLMVTFLFYRQKTRLSSRLQQQHGVLFDQKKVIEDQRADLEEVNKLKDKLLAIIGHDLRTPIASMSSIADLFSIGYITSDEVSKLMADLAPVVKGAELTLSNLMDFAGSQLKGQAVMAANVNMFLITVEIKKTFEHQLQNKNIAFNNNCSFEANVWADTNHVKVIMRNLISNAIKFTNNDGVINISSSLHGNFMVISVEDTGVGMTQDEVDKLFVANQHFSQQGTSGEKGTGLGLLLCKELVELNHGKLWVEAEEGKGCRFNFSLPTLPVNA